MNTALLPRRTALLFAAILIPLIFAIKYFAAPRPPVVNEKGMRAKLLPDGIIITTPIIQSGGSITGTLNIELIDATGDKLAGESTIVTLAQGENFPTTRIAWSWLVEEDEQEDRC